MSALPLKSTGKNTSTVAWAWTYSLTPDSNAGISNPPILTDSSVNYAQIIGDNQREHTVRGLCRGVPVTLRDKVVSVFVGLGKQNNVKASLQGEVLIYHLAHGLGLDFARVWVGFRVMQEVHNHIIRQQIVDAVNEVAERNCHIGIFLITYLAGAVKQFVDEKILRIVNDIPFQLGVFEDAADVLVGGAGLDLVITLERQTPLFNGEDTNLVRL